MKMGDLIVFSLSGWVSLYIDLLKKSVCLFVIVLDILPSTIAKVNRDDALFEPAGIILY
jgi:hypothetical protein